ncbi:MAG: hypothetical protein Q8S24_11345 [Eubacteriales bacterium]|nr:hypothetical protein [Eubacteriales bacterium]
MILKRILAIVIIVALTAVIFGCSKPQENQTDPPATTAVPQTTTVQQTETTTEQTTTTEVPVELEGFELLETINYTMPDSYVMETTISMSDMTSIMTTYFKGGSQRTENMNMGIKSISIYDADEGMTYMYNEGDSTGFMSSDDVYHGEESAVVDWEGTSLADAFADQPVVEAKIVTINGKEAVYMELKNTYEGYNQVTRFWYSVAYPILYRYEIEDSGTIIVTGETTKFEINVPLDDSLFEKPEGIEFQNY